MRAHFRLFIAIVALSVSAPAWAEGGAGTAFGAGLATGASELHLQFGWPGLSATYLYGFSNKLALGGRLSFNYGYEGVVGATALGLKAQADLRIGLVDTGRVNLALDLSPGLFTYFAGFIYYPIGYGGTSFGLALPVALVLGIPVGDALAFHVAMDMPMEALFAPVGRFFLPILFGGGLEYAIDRKMSLTFALRMGPLIDTAFNYAVFDMNAMFGLGLKI